jgi:GntR family transcriptional regulator, transcriptional repressor for pyruvate dehydrogenase complex
MIGIVWQVVQAREVAVTLSSRPPKTALIVAQRIIRDASREGRRPGDGLPSEREMLVRYETGRATLRESLRLLEFQGVISIKPGAGGGPVLVDPDASHLAGSLVVLMQLKRAPLRAIIEVRSAVEPMISALAAGRMKADALDALAQTLHVMRRDPEDQQTFLDANRRFHEIVSRSSGNPLFDYIIEAVLDIMDGVVVGSEYPLRRRSAIIAAHEAISHAFEAGDPAAAETLMRAHILEYQHYLERLFLDVLDSPIPWFGR